MCQVLSCVSFTDIFIEYKINAFHYFLTVLFQKVSQVKNTQAEVKWYPCADINSNVCHLEHRTVSIIKYVVKAIHYLTCYISFQKQILEFSLCMLSLLA